MNQTSTVTATATSASAVNLAARKPLTLPCPCCDEPKASVCVKLYCLDEPDDTLFHCDDCGNDITLDEVRGLIDRARRWEAVVAWVDAVPQFDDEDE